MTIIHKYLTREIAKQLTIVLITVICVYVIIDFFEKSDDFVRAGLPLSRTLTYFLLNIPFIVSQIAPVAVLLAVIIVFSLMKKNNEILALQSSGVSIQGLLVPIMVLGLAGSLLFFLFSEIIVPMTTTRANRIWISEVKKKSVMTSREKNIWIKGDGRITHITYYDPKKKMLFGITVNLFDENFRLVRKTDAERGLFGEEGKWVMHQVLDQTLHPSQDMSDVTFHERMVMDLDFFPEDLIRVAKTPAEMGVFELWTYIRKVEGEGYDATSYRVDFNAKPAYAFVCVIMSLIGMGLAVRQRQRSIFFSVSYGIAAAFCYWIFYSFCLSLGYGDMLSPVIAAWTANLVFLCIASLILVNVE